MNKLIRIIAIPKQTEAAVFFRSQREFARPSNNQKILRQISLHSKGVAIKRRYGNSLSLWERVRVRVALVIGSIPSPKGSGFFRNDQSRILDQPLPRCHPSGNEVSPEDPFIHRFYRSSGLAADASLRRMTAGKNIIFQPLSTLVIGSVQRRRRGNPGIFSSARAISFSSALFLSLLTFFSEGAMAAALASEEENTLIRCTPSPYEPSFKTALLCYMLLPEAETRVAPLVSERKDAQDDREEDFYLVGPDDLDYLSTCRSPFDPVAKYIEYSTTYAGRDDSGGLSLDVSCIHQNPWLDLVKPSLLEMTAVFHNLTPHHRSLWMYPNAPERAQLRRTLEAQAEGEHEKKYSWTSQIIFGEKNGDTPPSINTIGAGIFRYCQELDTIIITFPNHRVTDWNLYNINDNLANLSVSMGIYLCPEKMFSPFHKPLCDLMDAWKGRITKDTKFILLEEEVVGWAELMTGWTMGWIMQNKTGLCAPAAGRILTKLKEFNGGNFDNTKENKLIYVITSKSPKKIQLDINLVKHVGLHNIVHLPFPQLDSNGQNAFPWSWRLEAIVNELVPGNKEAAKH